MFQGRIKLLPSVEFLESRRLLSADLNRDGQVDFADFLILADAFGETVDAFGVGADLDGDGKVGFGDFLVLAGNFGATVSADTSSVQLASIEDRTILSAGHDAFKTATSVPSVSPVLPDALPGDLVVSYAGLAGPDMTAVVLKPRGDANVFEIPVPQPGVDVYRFLQHQLESASEEGARNILFPTSHHFEIVPPEGTAHLVISELHDVVIDLNGSTLTFTQQSLGVRFEESSRVVFRNGTLLGHGVLSTIAKVLPDDSAAGIRFEPLPEFRQQLDSVSNGVPKLVTVGSVEKAADGGWRFKSDGYSELFTNRGATTNNFRYKSGSFVATSGLLDGNNPFGTEQAYVYLLHENNVGHGLFLDNEDGLEDITIEDVKFVNIPGMAIVGEVKRGLHLNRLTFAVEESGHALLASSSDAVHINANGGDIVIENSTFGPNADDKINIKGNYWKVTELDRATNTLTVAPVDRDVSIRRWGSSDNRLVFIDAHFGVTGQATLREDSVRLRDKHHRLALDSIPPGIDVGSLVGNVDASGGRIVIRNNAFRETRAQGVLVQSSHVVVEDNSFAGIAGPPIKLNLALELWYESINTSNVLIHNNTFDRSAFSTAKSKELIYVRQFDAAQTRVEIIDKVKITGNRLLER